MPIERTDSVQPAGSSVAATALSNPAGTAVSSPVGAETGAGAAGGGGDRGGRRQRLVGRRDRPARRLAQRAGHGDATAREQDGGDDEHRHPGFPDAFRWRQRSAGSEVLVAHGALVLAGLGAAATAR